MYFCLTTGIILLLSKDDSEGILSRDDSEGIFMVDLMVANCFSNWTLQSCWKNPIEFSVHKKSIEICGTTFELEEESAGDDWMDPSHIRVTKFRRTGLLSTDLQCDCVQCSLFDYNGFYPVTKTSAAVQIVGRSIWRKKSIMKSTYEYPLHSDRAMGDAHCTPDTHVQCALHGIGSVCDRLIDWLLGWGLKWSFSFYLKSS